jgi:hypothetical protein
MKNNYFSMLSGIWKSFIRGGDIFDYHNFPFDISTPLPPIATQSLLKVFCLLNQLNANFRFTDGTALGLYREEKFISGDNDIDVDLLDFKGALILIKLFLNNGFSIGRFVYAKKNVQQISFYDESNVVVDLVFWWSHKSNQIVNYVEPGYVRVQANNYFTEKTLFPFRDAIIPLPGDIENWLVCRYGNDWKIPKKTNGDWKDHCNDISPILKINI